MPDVWTAVQDLDRATQERLADVLEKRGADAQQHAMRRAFLQEVPFPQDARVLDVGCGTGVLTRVLARWPAVRSVIGVDPAPALLEKARLAAADLPNVSFHEGDGRRELRGIVRHWVHRSVDNPSEVMVTLELDENGHEQLILAQMPDVQAAMLVMEQSTGSIRAMVGGYDFHTNKFNNATQGLRQTGSCYKPFIYTAAVEDGRPR